MQTFPTTRRVLVRGLLIVLGVAAGAAWFTAPAAAVKPDQYPVNFVQDVILTGFCAFPINVHMDVKSDAIDHYDNSGALTRSFNHGVEQDTLSANGHTLVGIPYQLTLEFIFDSSGNLIHMYGSGHFEKVMLPDGGHFFSAGRTDFLLSPYSVVLSPDKGNPGDVDALCAALAP